MPPQQCNATARLPPLSRHTTTAAALGGRRRPPPSQTTQTLHQLLRRRQGRGGARRDARSSPCRPRLFIAFLPPATLPPKSKDEGRRRRRRRRRPPLPPEGRGRQVACRQRRMIGRELSSTMSALVCDGIRSHGTYLFCIRRRTAIEIGPSYQHQQQSDSQTIVALLRFASNCVWDHSRGRGSRCHALRGDECQFVFDCWVKLGVCFIANTVALGGHPTSTHPRRAL